MDSVNTPNSNLKTKLIKNTAANYVIRFWSWGISFFLFPFIVSHLGVAAAGVWLLVSSFTSYFGVLNLGIGPSLTKYVSQYSTRGDKVRLNQYVSTAFFIYLGMGTLAAIGMFAVGRFFITVFSIPANLVEEARAITYILAATMFLGFPMGAFGGILSGLQRYDLSALIGFITSIPYVFLVLTLLPRGHGMVTLMLINLGTSAAAWSLNVYFALRILPSMRIRLSLLSKKVLRSLFGLALSLFVVQICMMIIYPTDKLIIAAFLPVGSIVFYEAAYKIYCLTLEVPHLLASPVIPAASELNASQDLQSLRNLFLRGTKYMTALFLAISVPMMLLSKEILVYWMGPDFGSYYFLAVVFVLHLFFNYNHLFAYHLLVGMNRLGLVPLTYYVGSAFLNLILSIVLVKKLGLMGVILGTVIPYAVLEPLFVSYNLKIFEVSPGTYFWQVIARAYPQALVVFLLLVFLKACYLPQNLVEVAAMAGLSALAYLLLFFLFGIEEWEKKSLTAAVGSALSEFRQGMDSKSLFR